MNKHTPAANWREKGDLDPHGSYYDRERAELPLGDLTDDELVNAVFLYGDTQPSIAEVIAGTAKMPIVYLTAGKERIRWLSRNLVKLEQQRDELLVALEGLLADMHLRAKLEGEVDSDGCVVLNCGNGVLHAARTAIAKAKGSAA